MKSRFLAVVLFCSVFLFTHCDQQVLFRGQSQSDGRPGVSLADTGDSLTRGINAVSALNRFSVVLLSPRDNPLIKISMDITLQIGMPPNAAARTSHYQIKYTVDKSSGSGVL